MKTTWRLWFIAALMPMSGVVQAAGYFDGALSSPGSFDEALETESIQQVTMLEPDLAEPPVAPPPPGGAVASSAPAPSSTIAGSMSNYGCDSGCGDACCDLASACGCGPRWSVRVGAVFLERDDPNRDVLLRNPNGGGALITADAFDFDDFETGPDVSIFRHTRSGNAWELRYFGVDEFENTIHRTFPGTTLPTNPPVVLPMSSATATYSSNLHSTELNWRSSHNERLALLAGFRWVEINDNISAVGSAGPGTASFELDANNHLYGGQIGADLDLLDRGGPWVIESIVKAGVFGNDADSTFDAALTPPGINLSTGGEESQVAFVGELGFTGVYQWNDRVAFRTGYQLLWVEGLALASEQIAITNPFAASGNINTEGGMFYHGATGGIEFMW